jgi:cysteine desulfurase / selenocysteine lyase
MRAMAAERSFKMTNIAKYRGDFPVLKTKMHGKPLAFLDSAASAQKPQAVIDAMSSVMETGYANIHRGLYQISQELTGKYEQVRTKVANFIGAESEKNIVFVRNTTEGINLVAQSWGRTHLKAGDEIILTQMEHHANIVPWQLLCDQIGIVIKTIPFDERGVLDLKAYEALLSPKTRLVAVSHVSNALGTINPVKKIIEIAKKFNPSLKALLDGSQAVVHGTVNVKNLGADFYVFTGHKLYGPTGIGVLYGKNDVLESMPPYQGGGDMIETVSFAKTTYKEPPFRFEAGTPAIVEVIGLGAAINYVSAIGMENIAAHEAGLLKYAMEQIKSIDGLTVYGTAPDKAGIISFTMTGAHPSDIGTILDRMGVAVRVGHHCCMPLMEQLKLDATARASFGLYSNKTDIDQWVEGLHKVRELMP